MTDTDSTVALWGLCFLVSSLIFFCAGEFGAGLFSLAFLYAVLKTGGL